MKREELKKELVQAGVPDYMYNLKGIGRTDERLCLEKNENGWMVYYMERGIKTTNKIFESENDACQFLYDQLVL